MKKQFLLVCAITLSALGLPPVRPVLPPVEHLDTETVTNVPFTAYQPHLRHFIVKLAFNATPSNNVEMSFGTDGSTGTTGILPVGNGSTGTTGVPPVEDGALSPDECDLVVGWDCGAWFVEDGATGERVTAAPAGDFGAHELVVRVRLRRGGAIDDVRFLDNGAEVFSELVASKPSWLHASGWNRLRLVGRGENVRAGERFFAQVTPDGTSVRMR